jgi:hypothetical protein
MTQSLIPLPVNVSQRDRQQRWFDHKQSDHLQLMYRLTLLPPFELHLPCINTRYLRREEWLDPLQM